MQSRKDQVQAHLFVMGRLSSSLLRDDPDTPDGPLGRTRKGMGCGFALAVVLGLGVALYGLLVPGGKTSWRTDGTFVVVKDSGARYLYAGETLYPVLNEASAKLLAGDRMTTKTVAAASLKGVTRGATTGVVGAPEDLPGNGELSRGAWSACSFPAAGTGTGTARPVLATVVGGLPAGRGLAKDEATLVRGPDRAVHVLWRGQRFRLDTEHGAQSALGWSGRTPREVGAEFLDTLPAGPALASPDVPARGKPGPRLSGTATRYGQLFSGAGGQTYVLRPDGLVALTPLQHALLLGDPRTQEQAYGGGAVRIAALGPSDLAAHSAPESVAAALARDLPSRTPRLVDAEGGQGVCADLTPAGNAPATSVSLRAATEVPRGTPAAQPGVRQGCARSAQVWVRPGTGVLAQALSSSGASGARYLVTDAGAAYPLAEAAVKQLGYGDGAATVRLPEAWLALLPTGPVLDPEALRAGGVVQEAAQAVGGNCAATGGGK
jgi:type VII secretion protein EccB